MGLAVALWLEEPTNNGTAKRLAFLGPEAFKASTDQRNQDRAGRSPIGLISFATGDEKIVLFFLRAAVFLRYTGKENFLL